MSKSQLRLLVIKFLSLSIGAVYLLAGFSHIANTHLFFGSVLSYDLLSYSGAWWAAVVLPWVEVSVGLALFAGILHRSVLGSSVVLSVIFVAVQLSAVSRGLEIDCGCFGSLAQHGIGRTSLLLASSMLLGTTVVIALHEWDVLRARALQ